MKTAIITPLRRGEGIVIFRNRHLLLFLSLLLSSVTSISGPVTACGSSSSESCSRAAATLRSSALRTLNVEHALTCSENNKSNMLTSNSEKMSNMNGRVFIEYPCFFTRIELQLLEGKTCKNDTQVSPCRHFRKTRQTVNCMVME